MFISYLQLFILHNKPINFTLSVQGCCCVPEQTFMCNELSLGATQLYIMLPSPKLDIIKCPLSFPYRPEIQSIDGYLGTSHTNSFHIIILKQICSLQALIHKRNRIKPTLFSLLLVWRGMLNLEYLLKKQVQLDMNSCNFSWRKFYLWLAIS